MISIPKPMLAQSADQLPVGRLWTYEVKWDGYRAIGVKDRGRVNVLSPPAHVDETIDVPLPDACPGCGGAVKHARVAFQVQEELPVVRPSASRSRLRRITDETSGTKGLELQASATWASHHELS